MHDFFRLNRNLFPRLSCPVLQPWAQLDTLEEGMDTFLMCAWNGPCWGMWSSRSSFHSPCLQNPLSVLHLTRFVHSKMTYETLYIQFWPWDWIWNKKRLFSGSHGWRGRGHPKWILCWKTSWLQAWDTFNASKREPGRFRFSPGFSLAWTDLIFSDWK